MKTELLFRRTPIPFELVFLKTRVSLNLHSKNVPWFSLILTHKYKYITWTLKFIVVCISSPITSVCHSQFISYPQCTLDTHTFTFLVLDQEISAFCLESEILYLSYLGNQWRNVFTKSYPTHNFHYIHILYVSVCSSQKELQLTWRSNYFFMKMRNLSLNVYSTHVS